MGWIEFESFWLFCPCFDDEFVRGKAFERFEASTIIVCADEIGEMSFELLLVPNVMVAFDSGFLNCSVHALDLTIGPGMLDLGEPMLDAIFPAVGPSA